MTGTGLGLLRSDPPAGGEPPTLTDEARGQGARAELLIITKANSRSTVHRPRLPRLRRRQDLRRRPGRVIGERRFLGLYRLHRLHRVGHSAARSSPRRSHGILERSGFTPGTHSGKDLLEVLETYPRDELFQAVARPALEVAIAVPRLQERRHTRLFLREDDYGRFMSCLVYIPRDRYNTAVRLRMARASSRKAFEGASVDYTRPGLREPRWRGCTSSCGSRARGSHPRRRRRARSSSGSSTRAARGSDGPRRGRSSRARRGGGRPADRPATAAPSRAAYKEDFTRPGGGRRPRAIDGLGTRTRSSSNLYRPGSRPRRRAPLQALPRRPALAHRGAADLHPHGRRGRRRAAVRGRARRRRDRPCLRLRPAGHATRRSGTGDDPRAAARAFQDAVAAVWTGGPSPTASTTWSSRAGLTWRQVVILRPIAKYLRQTRSTFSQDYLEERLVSNPASPARSSTCSRCASTPTGMPARPSEDRDAAEEAVAAPDRSERLDEVATLDQDRIIRAFLGVIRAGAAHELLPARRARRAPSRYVSLKLDPKRARPAAPRGRCSRSGSTARGSRACTCASARSPAAACAGRTGARTSAPRSSGLVKAQMVKNAVIVPTGSKGGFFAKQLPDPAVDRDAWLDRGHRGLPDLHLRPARRHRQPGRRARSSRPSASCGTTATTPTSSSPPTRAPRPSPTSPTASPRPTASGSTTPSPPAARPATTTRRMGITARGAWESVKRHFREMGVDTQSEDFTVVGVGDMSGDVFGNGMLLSPHIRLVAAFDHRHIFLDPDPDAGDVLRRAPAALRPAPLVVGRLRHERSSARAAASSPAPRSRSGHARRCARRSACPRARRDDAGRADARASCSRRSTCCGTAASAPTSRRRPRATPRSATAPTTRSGSTATSCGSGSSARAATSGSPSWAASRRRCTAVRVNTDAIDNSAGVDTSDHEVNIKILLGDVVREGDMTVEAAQRAARVDDRRGRRPGAARQLRAERPARQRPGPGARRCCPSTSG